MSEEIAFVDEEQSQRSSHFARQDRRFGEIHPSPAAFKSYFEALVSHSDPS